jgi:hypothetical protein
MKFILCSLLTLLTCSKLRAADFVTIWDLSKTGNSHSSIKVYPSVTGVVNYTWETIPTGTTGSGSFSTQYVTITGIPYNATIRLKIAPTN